MSKPFSIKMMILLLLLFSCSAIYSQSVSQHKFNYKGFSIIINDDALDENENHFLVGEIRAIEEEEKNRDPFINKIFDLKGYCNDDRMGIIITTDKNYKTLQIKQTFIGKKVVYNRTKKQFTIGANFFDYLQVGDDSFSAWQPIIIEMNFQLNGKVYSIQKPYSCILQNIEIENNEILIFTKSSIDITNEFKFNQKAEVIRISTSKFHNDIKKTWLKVLDPILTIETPYNDVGRMTLSDVSKVDNTYYFTTSNLNQTTLKNSNHLYQLKNDKLTEIMDFLDYLEYNAHDSDWININEFITNSSTNHLFLTHVGASNKEMVFSKTDSNFNKLISKRIPINDYADYNKMLVLSNGNIVILMANNKKTWSYFLYNSNMQLIKEIVSSISAEYYPNMLKEIMGNHIECAYYIDNIKIKDCIIERIN